MIHNTGAIAAEMKGRVNNLLLENHLPFKYGEIIPSLWINAGVAGITPPMVAIMRTPYPLLIHISWINGVLFTGGHPPAAS
jgi:hypothetical protein